MSRVPRVPKDLTVLDDFTLLDLRQKVALGRAHLQERDRIDTTRFIEEGVPTRLRLRQVRNRRLEIWGLEILALETEMGRRRLLRREKESLNGATFKVMFMKVAKEKLARDVYLDLIATTQGRMDRQASDDQSSADAD